MNSSVISIRGNGWYAEVSPSLGANPILLQYEGKDVLMPRTEENTNPFLAGSPLLLPANRTAGGKFTFGGKEYSLPITDMLQCANLHGSLYQQEFRVLGQEKDSAVFSYENRGEIFPFPFVIRVTYRAKKEGFFSEYVIENVGEGEMPVSFALHTTFREPELFSVPLDACQEKDARHIPTGRMIPLNEKEERYCVGSPSKGIEISGYYRAAGDTACIGEYLRYRVKGFDHWILYNGKGVSGLLCVEPQLGGVNVLNDPKNCPVIPAKTAIRLETRLFWEGKPSD